MVALEKYLAVHPDANVKQMAKHLRVRQETVYSLLHELNRGALLRGNISQAHLVTGWLVSHPGQPIVAAHIAREVGLSSQVVLKHLHRMGVTLQKLGWTSDSRANALATRSNTPYKRGLLGRTQAEQEEVVARIAEARAAKEASGAVDRPGVVEWECPVVRVPRRNFREYDI